MRTYYVPGAGMIHGQRLTLSDRIRMRKARKRRERMWMLF